MAAIVSPERHDRGTAFIQQALSTKAICRCPANPCNENPPPTSASGGQFQFMANYFGTAEVKRAPLGKEGIGETGVFVAERILSSIRRRR